MASQKVFICYRRQETAAHAGRLYDALVARLGEENVFMDVEMPPGVDFVERITRVVSGCVALVVVIGPTWAAAEDGNGRRRLDDPADFVRLEVETGLRRPEVTPIPVLVSGARMPAQEELPDELRPLARRNALELSEGRWSYDAGRLLARLEELLPGRAAASPAPEAPKPSKPRAEPSQAQSDRALIARGAAIAAVSAAAGRLLGNGILKSVPWESLSYGTEMADPLATLTAYSVVASIPVGAALALWLGRRRDADALVRYAAVGAAFAALAGALDALFWGGLLFPGGYDTEVDLDEAAAVQLGALFLFGGGLGFLVGWLWNPRRLAAATAAGAIAGALYQVVFGLALGWKDQSYAEVGLSYTLVTTLIVAAALVAVVRLDRSQREPAL